MKHDNRKNEHVSLAEYFYNDQPSTFEDVHFVHHSFPEIDFSDVSLKTNFLDTEIPVPYFINAMTGGSEWTKTVNEKLATVAKSLEIPMALGSLSAALKDKELASSYSIVREIYPDGYFLANLGAGHGAKNAQRAIDLIDANALQIHLNAPQEVVMPEGDREFKSWKENIEEIVQTIKVPIIVKEVGFGMSRETIEWLDRIGVAAIDISGRGGTNFAQIENYRRKKQGAFDLSDFESCGQSTPISLLEAVAAQPHTQIIASGGIKSSLDITKSLALGAHTVGVAGEILHQAIKDPQKAIASCQRWNEELVRWLVLLGAKTPNDLQHTDLIISGETAQWANLRNIDIKQFANRR